MIPQPVSIIRRLRHALALTGVAAGSFLSSSMGEEEGVRLFALKVFPLLKEKCFACHGEDPGKIEGGLSLVSRDGMLRGGGELAAGAGRGPSGG